eukprot:Gb_29516 [translate_table: standard]
MEFGGAGFGSGKILLGEIEIFQVSTFEKIWSSNEGGKDDKGASFYKPIGVPKGYFSLGHYGQPNSDPFQGLMIVATDSIVSTKFRADSEESEAAMEGMSTIHELQSTQFGSESVQPAAMEKPSDYNLIWSSESWAGKQDGHGYFWVPQPPQGYKALGFVVTNTPEKPGVEQVRCVRSDLTDMCEIDGMIWSTEANTHKNVFSAWNVRPKVRGVKAPGVFVGTCYCNNDLNPENTLPIACLKNVSSDNLSAMPNIKQVHEIVQNYGPTVFFHPDEKYFPSSVNWFFKNGALLYKKDTTIPPEPIAMDGSNLPQGGSNDGEYWLDLPKDDGARKIEKQGDLQSAEVYVHIKPMLGGTFSDVVMWMFYPFNGAGTLRVGLLNIPLKKLGEHVGDWEHFTLRISNFTGKLWRVYLSQHRAGQWVSASSLEYLEGNNKALIYSAKSGHANFPHEGNFLQGNTKLGIGSRNDTARSKYFVDTSRKYQIISAEYLRDQLPQEPPWLQYMRNWGPKIVYDRRAELDRILRFVPSKLRSSVEHFFNDDLPKEISGEEGPSGPKAKENWEGDEND